MRLAFYAPAEHGLAALSLSLSICPSLAQLCSLLMISLFGIPCAVLNLRYQIALLAKNTKRHTDKRQKSQKKSS